MTGVGDPSHALFRRAELDAERLVARLRMGIAAALAGVFLIAVIAPGAPADPVLMRQWLFAGVTLTAYFLLGLASYFAERRGRYRPWMSWLTVTGDCAFLHLSLWLALGNTGLSGGYLVALPSIWLAPAVLAFGALRFNPLLQAYVLILVAAGFAALGAIGFAPPADRLPPPEALNLFFSPPPNVMRLAMLTLAGAVLVVASLRARRLLARSIAETRRRMNLTRYLPQEIAGRLAEGGLDELRRGERRQVAVLFVDIRDFTRMTETMAPEAIGALATDFRRSVAVAAGATGGVIDKFIGDAAMVVFGLGDAPQKARHPAAAALACARMLVKDMASAGPPLRVGVGVHWGDAYCGAIGDESRLEFTVLGDVVNVAARLEELTKSAGAAIVASADALAAAGAEPGRDGWRALPSTEIRGRSGALALYGADG